MSSLINLLFNIYVAFYLGQEEKRSQAQAIKKVFQLIHIHIYSINHITKIFNLLLQGTRATGSVRMSATWAPKLAATRYVSITPSRLRYVYGVASPHAILA